VEDRLRRVFGIRRWGVIEGRKVAGDLLRREVVAVDPVQQFRQDGTRVGNAQMQRDVIGVHVHEGEAGARSHHHL
jgi:hypothetical protein